MLRDRVLAALAPGRTVDAHCDIPCGIYDPATAQIAARTVSRMTQLIEANNASSDLNDRNNYVRCTVVKEEHAEKVKHEVQIIWSDYFKPEHVEKFPELHDLSWRILKQASKCKQSVDPAACAQLEQMVGRFAEIFWQTKGGKAHLMAPPADGQPLQNIQWEIR